MLIDWLFERLRKDSVNDDDDAILFGAFNVKMLSCLFMFEQLES